MGVGATGIAARNAVGLVLIFIIIYYRSINTKAEALISLRTNKRTYQAGIQDYAGVIPHGPGGIYLAGGSEYFREGGDLIT